MSQNRRNQRWGRLLMVALLGSLWAGCGSSDAGSGSFGTAGIGGSAGSGGIPDEGAGGAGGGVAPNFDGGVSGYYDNPIEQLFANPQRNPFDLLATDAQEGVDYVQTAVACYAPADSCTGTDCGAFASCCVDSGSCCKAAANPSLPGLLDFQSCVGQTLGVCTDDAGVDFATFGPAQPSLTARGFVPNGTVAAESGSVLGAPVNLSSERVRVELQFSLPAGCDSSCLETAGIAFTASDPDVRVDADVGLLLSGARRVVSLLIGGAVVDSFDAGVNSTVWSLILSPSGRVEVERDGSSEGAYTFDSASLTDARLILFGRNLLSEANSAAVARVAIETQVCDNPRAWTDRQPMSVTVQGSASPALAGARSPSIARHQGFTKVAFELDGEIFVGDREAPSLLDLIDEVPALSPTEPYEAMGVGDPELVSEGALLRLFYTARDANGMGSIAAAVALTPSADVFVKGGDLILVPVGDVVSFEAPSVVFREGLWLLVVRATRASGATELQAYYSGNVEGGWERIVNGGLEELTRVEEATSAVSDPSLVVHNSAYHLYYARRSGTRWSVELAVSDELVLWRGLGETLGGSGSGFDSLGARSPDALSQLDRIDLVYAGQNGVSFQLGSASRAAPSDTAPSIF